MRKLKAVGRKILKILPDTMKTHGVIEEVTNGGYKCPVCDNGTGEDATGLELVNMGDHYGAHCFKCGSNLNNFHFLAKHYGLDRKKDFKEIVKRAAEEFNLDDSPVKEKNISVEKKISSAEKNSPTEKISVPEKNSSTEVNLIHADILKAAQNLKNFIESQGGLWRGLNFESLKKFNCGYLQDWIHPKNRCGGKKVLSSRRFIIPTENHYNAVVLNEDRTEKNKKWWKMHAGSKEVFGLNLVPDDAENLIVVEGEIDAMSIYQATKGKFNVIATGGAAEKNFVKFLNEKFLEQKPRILVLFDPDDAGRKNAPKLCRLLEKNNFTADFKFLTENFSKVDANQILVEHGEEKLAELVEKLIGDFKKGEEIMYKRVLSVDSAEEEFSQSEIPAPQKRTTRSIIPNCPVDYYLPYNFGFSEKGITRYSKTYGEVIVSYTPVVITRRFFEPKSKKMKYEIAYRTYKGTWDTLVCEKGVFSDQRKIMQLADYDIDFTSSDAKYLVKFLNAFIHAGDNATKMETFRAFNQPGWNDDFTEFIYPLGGKDYICQRDGIDYQQIFKPKGNKKTWVETFKKISKDIGAVANTFIGAAAVAPLVKPLELPNIQVHVNGKRGIGKSPLPKFAASIFGNPRAGDLTRTFAGTMKNKLETAAAFKDLPMILDELETISKQEENKLSTMIYDYSLGVANQANKRDGTSREPVKFSGSRLSTGERELVKDNDKGGAFKRVLDIHVNSLFEDAFAKELHSLSEKNYGLFGQEWIDYVMNNLDKIKEDFLDTLSFCHEAGFFSEDKFKKIEVEPTHLKAVVACFTAYKHFTKMIGVEYSEENLYKDISEIVTKLPTAKEIDDTKRAKEALASYVAGHKKFFVTENKNSKDCPENDAVAFETYGKIFENGEVAILPHKLKQILEGELGFASASKLIAEWVHEGNLRTQGNGNSYKTRINNKVQWTYRFKADTLIAPDTTDEEKAVG